MTRFIPNIVGLRALRRNRQVIRGLYPWARLVVVRARGRAPRRTGKLQANIRIVEDPWRLRVVSEARDPKGFLYAAIQEGRRPYLRPSIR